MLLLIPLEAEEKSTVYSLRLWDRERGKTEVITEITFIIKMSVRTQNLDFP